MGAVGLSSWFEAASRGADQGSRWGRQSAVAHTLVLPRSTTTTGAAMPFTETRPQTEWKIVKKRRNTSPTALLADRRGLLYLGWCVHGCGTRGPRGGGPQWGCSNAYKLQLFDVRLHVGLVRLWGLLLGQLRDLVPWYGVHALYVVAILRQGWPAPPIPLRLLVQVSTRHRRLNEHAKFHKAEEIEGRVREFVYGLLHDPEALRQQVLGQLELDRAGWGASRRRRASSRNGSPRPIASATATSGSPPLGASPRRSWTATSRSLSNARGRRERLSELDELAEPVEKYLGDLPHLVDRMPPVREYVTVPAERELGLETGRTARSLSTRLPPSAPRRKWRNYA